MANTASARQVPKKTESQEQFPLASAVLPAHFDSKFYDLRTARNQFWTGGKEGQERLRRMKIAVAGLGGMGSNIAELLVRAGVGHLRIADPDTIEATNLNRQVIANRRTIGTTKVAATIEKLRGISEDFELVAYDQGVTSVMTEEFVEGCDAVIDEIDVFPLQAHRVLHQAARRRDIPVYSTFVVGVGIHLYKFRGNGFTFEDFLGLKDSPLCEAPTPEFLVKTFGHPMPRYLTGKVLEDFMGALRSGEVPIFGPSTLLGQSLLTIRMMSDLLGITSGSSESDLPTPEMPEFLVLDPMGLSIKKARFPR